MSRENVELVQAVIDATERRDWDAVYARYAPEIALDFTRTKNIALPRSGEVFRGHQAWRRTMREFNEAWETVGYEHEGLLDAGDRSSTCSVSVSSGAPPTSNLLGPMPRSGQSGEDCSPAWTTTRIAPRPSKPPGCRSSREYCFGREAAIALHGKQRSDVHFRFSRKGQRELELLLQLHLQRLGAGTPPVGV